MADLNHISAGTPVVWEDVRNLAEHIDQLAYDKVFQPHSEQERGSSGSVCNLKYNKNVGSSYLYNMFPDLKHDVTTPFPVKFPCITNKQQDEDILYLRFEFGYYRLDFQTKEYLFEPVEEKSASYTQRYYKTGEREPVLHTMFIQRDKPLVGEASNLGYVTPMPFAEVLNENNIQNIVRPERVSLVYNLIENKHHLLYKWWPCISHYDNKQTIASELYFKGNNASETGTSECVPYHRVCHAYSGLDSKNGNGNLIVAQTYQVLWADNSELLTIEGGDRPYLAYDNTVYSFGPKEAVTLNRVDYNTFSPEYFIDGICYGYTPPPVCQSCIKVLYPVIGWEGGNHKYEDGSAWTAFHAPSSFIKAFSDSTENADQGEQFSDGKYSTLYPPTIFLPGYDGGANTTKPYTLVVEYNPREELEGSIREYNMATYKLNWCYPEDLDAYEICSHYEEWEAGLSAGGGHLKLFVRVTPLLFYLANTDNPPIGINPDDLPYDVTSNWAFVWVPTAIIVPIKGEYLPAIRKRWYDMMYHKLRYIAGLWEGGKLIVEKINCGDTSDRGLTGNYLYGAPPLHLGNNFSASTNLDELLFIEDAYHHPCVSLDSEELPEDNYSPNPVGVTWDYHTDHEISKRDAQCARWQAYGTSWSGEDKEKIGDSKFYCLAYFGLEHIDLMISSLGIYGDDLGYSASPHISSEGGFCILKDPKDCSDALVSRSRSTTPWRGASYSACTYLTCSTSIQDPTADAIPFIHTYADTINVLIDLYKFIEKHKCKELTEENLWAIVNEVTGCGPHWEKKLSECQAIPDAEVLAGLIDIVELYDAIRYAQEVGCEISKAVALTDCELIIKFGEDEYATVSGANPLKYIDYVISGKDLVVMQASWAYPWELTRVLGFILGDYGSNNYSIIELRYTLKCIGDFTAEVDIYVIKIDSNGSETVLLRSIGYSDYCGGFRRSCPIKLTTSIFKEAFSSLDADTLSKPLKWYAYQDAHYSTIYYDHVSGRWDITDYFKPGSPYKIDLGSFTVSIPGKTFLNSGCGNWEVKAPDNCYDDITKSTLTLNQIVAIYSDPSNVSRILVESYTGKADDMPKLSSGYTDSIIISVAPYNPGDLGSQELIPGDNSCNAACTVWMPYLFSGPKYGYGEREHSLTLKVSSPMKLFATKANTYHLRDSKGDTNATYRDSSSSGIPESPHVVLVKNADTYIKEQANVNCNSAKPIVTAANEGGGALIKPWLAPLGIKEGLDFGLEAKFLSGQVEIDDLKYQNNDGLKESASTYVRRPHPSGSLLWKNVKFKVSNLYRGYIGFTIFLSAFLKDAQSSNSDLEYLAYKPKKEYFLIEVHHD